MYNRTIDDLAKAMKRAANCYASTDHEKTGILHNIADKDIFNDIVKTLIGATDVIAAVSAKEEYKKLSVKECYENGRWEDEVKYGSSHSHRAGAPVGEDDRNNAPHVTGDLI